MNSLSDLEKKINSELTTKINDSKIVHEQLYLSIDNEDLPDVVLFIKKMVEHKDLDVRRCRLPVVRYPTSNTHTTSSMIFVLTM
mgnify:CR=1 FL=1